MINNKVSEKHDALVAWLKEKCEKSDDVFQDPGYTAFYKSHFNIMDVNNIFYSNDDDIDHELNVGYTDYTDDKEPKDPQDECIEQFIDYINDYDDYNNDDLLDTEKTNVNPMDSTVEPEQLKHNIVILPGSKHSNVNYLYKRLIMFADNLEPYNVPFIQGDSKNSFTPKSKDVYIEIDKEKFYQFIKNLSLHQTR
jgi:hypothetical protein